MRKERNREDGLELRRRVAFATQGCKVNQSDTMSLQAAFRARGWQVLPFGAEADLTVINSCTVTEGSDRDLRKLLGRARRSGVAGKILVTGCLAQVDPEACAVLEGVSFVLGNTEKGAIPDLAERNALAGMESQEIDSFPERIEYSAILNDEKSDRGRPILKLQDGCPLRCSYCIVPRARGESRSLGAADALATARDLESAGYGELVLSGIQLGFYRDPDGGPRNLAELLTVLLDGSERIRFRLGSLLPRHVTPELLSLFAEEPRRLCPHFHISLQSGDDDVLRAMKRPYRRAYYSDLLERIVAELGDPCLGTDLIAGFPSEDEAAFENTLHFVSELPLSYGHVFPFSPRPGTRAATMPDGSERAEKMKRGARLRKVLAAKSDAYRRRQVGGNLFVVQERRLADGRWTGTSENYQKLIFPLADANARAGAIRELVVEEAPDGARELTARMASPVMGEEAGA